MKPAMFFPRSLNRVLIAAVFLLAATFAALAQGDGQFSIDSSPLPQPTEPVNDFAGVLSPQTVGELNKKIKDLKSRTNPQVVLAVAIVRTTDGRDIFDYSLAVARGWKIGTDKDDNPSALLFIAIDDRKYFTQVSRDLEDEMPDGAVGQLQRKYLVPAFKQRDYDKGVRDTIDAYIATIEGKVETLDVAPTTGRRASSGEEPSLLKMCIFIVVLLIFVAFFSRRRGIFFFIGGGGGGGGWDGGGGGDWGGFSGGDFGGGGAGGDW